MYGVLVLLYSYTLCVAARIIAFPSHLFCIRHAAAHSLVAFAFCPAASLEILVVCYSLLANTTRSAVIRSHRVDSPPRLWEEESVAGTTRHGTSLPGTSHLLSTLSRRYIFYY